MLKIGEFRGSNVYFDTDNSPNKHMLILGQTGMGKSVFAQKVLLQVINLGGTVLTFDIHQTLRPEQLLETYRSEFTDFVNDIDAYQKGIRFPLFTPVVGNQMESENKYDIIFATVDIFARVFNLKCRQRVALRKAIESVFIKGTYDAEGIKAIGNELLIRDDSVSEGVSDKLYQITSRNLFRPGKFELAENRINVVQLSKLDSDTQRLVVEIVLSYIWRLAISGVFFDRPVYLFLDEVQNMSLGENSAVTKLLTEGRKLGVSLIIATQSLPGKSLDIQQKRLLQAGLKVFFHPIESEIPDIAKKLDSSKRREMEALLTSLRIGEFTGIGNMICGKGKFNIPLKISAKS